MMLSEFYWSRGKGKRSQRADAKWPRNRSAAWLIATTSSKARRSGFVVGIEWFTLIDQAVTGRWFQGFDGERANTGVISVTDRPWKAMLEEMMKTNYDIYQVWLGERAPFALDDPRFRADR